MASNRGFASFQALIIMIFVTLAGAYLLKSASKEAGTAGGYFQMRSAVSAAQAGLAAGMAQLEADPDAAAALLEEWMNDDSRQWLLGGATATASRNVIKLPTTGQAYSARITAFDTASGIVKIQAEGTGIGGSVSRVTGMWRLEGATSHAPIAQPPHALFLVGDGRTLDAPMQVDGAAYFEGAFNLAGTASGTEFKGPVKIAALGSGGFARLQGSVQFSDNAYFESPLRIQAATTFAKLAGFDDDLILDGNTRLLGEGAFANGMLSGTQRFDLGGGSLTHSGFADPLHLTNPGTLTDNGRPIDIPAALAMPPGQEEEFGFNFSAIPAAKVHYATAEGFPDIIDPAYLTQFYHDKHGVVDEDLGTAERFMIIVIDKPMALVKAPDPKDNEMYKWFILVVRSTLNVDGNLWTTVACPELSTCPGLMGNVMFYVPDGGAVTGLGGDGFFRGYVRAEGTGSVSYRWGAGGSMAGAVHHLSAQSGFRVDGPNPFRIGYDSTVFTELNTLPGFTPVPAPSGSTAPLRLVDTRIRPVFLGQYY